MDFCLETNRLPSLVDVSKTNRSFDNWPLSPLVVASSGKLVKYFPGSQLYPRKQTGRESMRGTRPEQASLSRDTDLSKTDETRRVIESMVDGLNDHKINGMDEFFSTTFRWMGNAGCGLKNGLQEFQDNWQKPFQAAFSDKVCIDEARLFMGEWAAAFGRQEAVHTGEFMGVAPTGKRVEIRYMDFWKVENGKITDNWVMVDFPHVMQQLGLDPFNGHGWEQFDRGEKSPAAPAHQL